MHADLSDSDFRRTYRITRQAFSDLLAKMERAGFGKAKKKGRPSRLSPAARLAMAIRYLAGGSYLDLRMIWKVQPKTFYAVVWDALSWIQKTEHLPNLLDPLVLERSRGTFQRKPGGEHFDGLVLAIDGVAVKIKQPDRDAELYKYRKG